MNRFLRIYLAAIALPALLLALFGAWLLRADARNRAAVRAENLHWLAGSHAAAVQAPARALLDERLDRLAAAPGDDARTALLRTLAASDPYVRNAFLWRENEGCVWPLRTGATEEERRFLNRCEPLFSGAVPWTPPATNAAAAPPPSRGYRPWAAGDRRELIAWLRTAPGEICGFEFESVRYLADLSDAWWRTYGLFAGPHGSGRRTAPRLAADLVDAATGVSLVPAAPDAVAADFGAAAEVPLAPLFPGWLLRAAPRRGLPPASGWHPDNLLPALLDSPAPRLALGGVFLGLLLLSLVAGGAVLLRAARRERLDALRKTDFVSNVSHELRTPLTAIRTYAELLAGGRLLDPARRRRALDTISAESARLSRLVDTLLDFSRLERGPRPLALVPLDLAALAAEIAESAPVRPSCTVPAAPVPALADRDAVRQILLNLLDNAAKYAPGSPPELVVAPMPSGGASVTVLDRGPGIPARDARRIFDRFVRLDDATTRTTAGYGLGLSIARRLALAMNATLSCSPRSPSGSAFTLALPPPPSPASHPSHPSPKSQKSQESHSSHESHESQESP